jgi:hypothetical protein
MVHKTPGDELPDLTYVTRLARPFLVMVPVRVGHDRGAPLDQKTNTGPRQEPWPTTRFTYHLTARPFSPRGVGTVARCHDQPSLLEDTVDRSGGRRQMAWEGHGGVRAAGLPSERQRRGAGHRLGALSQAVAVA